MMPSQVRCGTKIDHLKPVNMTFYLRETARHDLALNMDMKIHYELLKYLYG